MRSPARQEREICLLDGRGKLKFKAQFSGASSNLHISSQRTVALPTFLVGQFGSLSFVPGIRFELCCLICFRLRDASVFPKNSVRKVGRKLSHRYAFVSGDPGWWSVGRATAQTRTFPWVRAVKSFLNALQIIRSKARRKV